jgi:RimJ/RimL family protein N-acetyltransferase
MNIVRRMRPPCRLRSSFSEGDGAAKVQEQYPCPGRPSSCGKDGLIETNRLRLRRLAPSDELDLIALDSDPDVMRYVGSPAGVKSPAETAERVRQRIETDHGALGFWRVESRTDGTFYGLGALLRMPTGDDVELAYRLARSAWGRGIATELGARLVEYALGDVGLPRVVAVTYPENRASQRVLEKLGFMRQGELDYKGARTVVYLVERARATSGAPERPRPPARG